MTITTNEWIASVASVATVGDLEILEREPFIARVGAIGLQSFVCESTDLTVLELFVPVAEVTSCAALDHWVARVAPALYNVHVAIRNVNDLCFVEVRSSLIADGLAVDGLTRALLLLRVGATEVHERLTAVLEAATQPQANEQLASTISLSTNIQGITEPPPHATASRMSSCSPGYL